MLGVFNNTNLNNMYVNPNFGYGQPAMNPYSFQQTSMFGINQTMFIQQPFPFGGNQQMPVQQPFPFISNQSMFAQPQQPANNINSMFMSLISLLLPALLGKNINTPQKPATTLPVTNTNQAQNPLTALFQNLLGNQNKVVEAKNFTNAGNLNNLYVVANDFDDINNLGNIGNVNVINKNDLAKLLGLKTPVQVDEETIEVIPKNEKVFIIGSYDQSIYNSKGAASLGDNIKHFAGAGKVEDKVDFGAIGVYNGDQANSWHNADKSNDKALMDLYSKMSDEDKKIAFNAGDAAYVITESGKIIGKIGASQVVNKASLTKVTGTNDNTQFKIIEDLGVEKNTKFENGATQLANNYWKVNVKNLEEATGGKIELDGKTYEVASTAIRKNTPLTFDLNGDGVKTSDKVIDYDIDGDGNLDKINDVADGTLSIRGGKSGLDVFGNNTDLDNDGKADGFKNGFDALKALAKKEGLINGKDDMKLDSKDLKILEDKYQLGMKTDGYNSKEKSLAELGITEINLGTTDEVTETANFDGRNNDVLTQEGATFKIDGQKREYADVLHEKK